MNLRGHEQDFEGPGRSLRGLWEGITEGSWEV